MAGQWCTSCNLETILSPTSLGPFSTVSGAPVINVGAGTAGNNTISLPQGSLVGLGLQVPGAAIPGLVTLPVSFALGFGLACATAPSSTTQILGITIGANTVVLSIEPSGTFTVQAGSAFTVTSTATFLYNGIRQYLEMYLSGTGAAQTCNLQYEGTSAGSGTGTAYTGSNFSLFEWGATAGLMADLILDSLYVVDLTGGARNNMLGKRVVTWQISAGVGQSSQYSPNGASLGYQCVAPIPPAGDLIYASDTTPGDQLAVAMSSPFGLASVDFVMERVSVRQEVPSGGRTLSIGIGNGSSVSYFPTPQNLPNTYTSINIPWDTNPTSSSTWTLAAAANSQASIETAS